MAVLKNIILACILVVLAGCTQAKDFEYGLNEINKINITLDIIEPILIFESSQRLLKSSGQVSTVPKGTAAKADGTKVRKETLDKDRAVIFFIPNMIVGSFLLFVKGVVWAKRIGR